MASKGQKFNSYSPELKQEILNKYFNQNQSYSSLALEYSVSKGTIKTWVFKTKNGNNISLDNRGRPKKEENILQVLCVRYLKENILSLSK